MFKEKIIREMKVVFKEIPFGIDHTLKVLQNAEDIMKGELIGTVISGFLRFRVKIRFFPRTTTVFAPRTTNPIRIFRQRRLQEV